MIRTGKWKIGFYNVGNTPEDADVFGCATLGAATSEQIIEPDAPGLFVWRENVRGTVISGGFDEVSEEIQSSCVPAKACIVLFAHGSGQEDFLAKLRSALPDASVAGGVSANRGGRGELSPEAEDVAVLLMAEDGYASFAENILKDTGRRFQLGLNGDLRRIDRLNGREALPLWRSLQAEYCVLKDNFERMTLADENGVNVHMNADGDRLNVGANCVDCAEYSLRFSRQKELDAAAARFMARKDALIIGCAGLKSALRTIPRTGARTLAVFLFGEIAFGRFGNLMMTGVRAENSD